MEFEEFRIYLLVDEALSEATAYTYVRRLQQARREGVDLDRFCADGEGATHEGRRWLAAGRRHLEPGGYNGRVRALNALARFAALDTRFKPLKPPRSQPKALSSAQLDRALAFHGQTFQSRLRTRALLQFAFTVGARASEVAALETRDLDSVQSTVEIRKPAKGGERRRLPVPRELWDPTRPFARWLEYRPIVSDDPGAVWTTNQRGDGSGVARRMSKTQLTRMMDAVRRQTGVHVNFVVARHTVAQRFADDPKNPASIEWIQFYLGHAKIQSTAIYGGMTEARAHARFREMKPTPLFPKRRDEP